MEGDDRGPARSHRLEVAVGRLWATMTDQYGLLPELDHDAVLARANRGELLAATPRLVDLLVGARLEVADAAALTGRLGGHDWDRVRRAAVEESLDAWWWETLQRSPGEHLEPYRPEVVLGVLAAYDAPMVRWLGPWLAQLDGPGAQHLAAVVLGGPDGLSGPAWSGREDRARQVLAWAGTEPVVNGLTLIGGIHLDDGVLGAVLDRLIA